MSVKYISKKAEVAAKLHKRIERGIMASAILFQNELKLELNKQRSIGRATSGQPPRSLTGDLKRSIQIDDTNIKSLIARVGTNKVYARILEYGGTIKSKGKKLTVPLNDKARRMLQRSGSVTKYKNLKFIISKKGNALLGLVKGRKKEFEPLFILKDKVKINPHPYFRPVIKRIMPKIKAKLKEIMGGK